MQMTKAIVYIEEGNSMADVTFPSMPVVISLLHYDDPIHAQNTRPPAGYPVICVTVCIEPCIPLSVLYCVSAILHRCPWGSRHCHFASLDVLNVPELWVTLSAPSSLSLPECHLQYHVIFVTEYHSH